MPVSYTHLYPDSTDFDDYLSVRRLYFQWADTRGGYADVLGLQLQRFFTHGGAHLSLIHIYAILNKLPVA